MTIDRIANTPSPIARATAEPRTAKEAAKQFEALLIGELMKESRSSDGWLGTGESDQAGQIGIEVAEQEFARMLAAKGGLGMAKMIEKAVK